MRKVIIAATVASLALSAPAAHANEWGGLAAGLAGGIIAGAIASSMQPHTVYVPVERRHYVAPRAPTRVVVVHDHTVVQRTVVAPVAVAAPVAVPVPVAAPANNNNIVVAPAPAPAPIIINNTTPAAPAPIVINTAAPAPAAPAAPTSAVADRCQGFEKTADYLACQKEVAAK